MKATIIAVVLLFLILCGALIAKVTNRVVKYNNAIKLMDECRFEEASAAFKSLGNYRQSEAYSDYCIARTCGAEGRYTEAYMYLTRIEKRHHLHPAFYPTGYQEFRQEVDEQWEAAIVKAAEDAEESYRKSVSSGIPFVGMYESDIGKMTLGRPNGTPWHNYEMERGKPVEATIYEWIRDGYVVFSARCFHGTVDYVRDDRAKPWKRASTGSSSVSKTTTSAKTSTKSSTRKKEDYDPLDAKSFNNSEDFYEENYYDFFDYYEAEDYYYEHGGQ